MKNQLTYSFLLLALVSFLFSDCSMQKRKYRSGYYVITKKGHVKVNENEPGRITYKNQMRKHLHTQRKDTKVSVEQEMGLIASAGKAGVKHTQKLSIRPLPSVEDSCGDKIVFLDGEEVLCKVLEVGTKNIVYKTCDNLQGPKISRSKEKVFMVKYQNGSTEVFEHQKVTPVALVKPVELGTQKKKMNGLSLAAFIVSLFSWTLVLAPVAFVMGIVGLMEIKKDSERLKGKGFAKAAIIISSIVIFLMLLVLISALL